MRIVIWIFLFYFVSSLSTYIMIARGEQTRMMWINGIIAIVNIVGNLIFIPYYSFVGSAWVTLITQILLMSITWWWVRDTIHIKKGILFALFMTTIACIGAWISSYIVSTFLITGASLVNIVVQVIIG
jgi:O-antigen/teichoic acid export membrane protein